MKPIKGAIVSWTIREGRVYGICLFHADDNRDTSIVTSDVIQISEPKTYGEDIRMCETRNSRYILIGDCQ